MPITADQLRREAARKLRKAELIETEGQTTFMLYLPRSLKERLRGGAQDEGVSMTEVLIRILEQNLPLNP